MISIYYLFESPFMTNPNSQQKLALRTKYALTNLKQKPEFNKLVGHYKQITGTDKEKLRTALRTVIKKEKMFAYRSRQDHENFVNKQNDFQFG